jgi:hypothetical protein
MTAGVESRLERLVSMSRTVLDRLDRGDRLSAILPQARALAESYGNKAHVHWLDCEIYGMLDVPFAKRPRRTTDEKAGVLLFCELNQTQDIRNLTVDGIKRRWPEVEVPNRDMVAHRSVGHLERLVEEHTQPAPGDGWVPSAEHVLQMGVLQREHQRVLDGVRAQVYQYMSSISSWAIQERENIALLGPDYRIVVESLDVLETDVGQVLLASLTSLNSANPADWSLSALACRNVILGLGRSLFAVRKGAYHCVMLDRDLELEGEKELNRLTGFIDLHWQKADGEVKEELKHLAESARQIYGIASGGKRGTELRHAQVQKLVVDTFHVVSRLRDITGLEPLD